MNSKKKLFLIYDEECLMCNNFIFYLDKFYLNTKLPIHVFSSIEKLQELSILDPNNFSFLIESNHDINRLKEISLSSIILIIENKIYIKSEAIVKILIKSKNTYMSILGKILFYINPKLRDTIYTFIAKNRLKISKIFKKKCSIKFSNIILHN